MGISPDTNIFGGLFFECPLVSIFQYYLYKQTSQTNFFWSILNTLSAVVSLVRTLIMKENWLKSKYTYFQFYLPILYIFGICKSLLFALNYFSAGKLWLALPQGIYWCSTYDRDRTQEKLHHVHKLSSSYENTSLFSIDNLTVHISIKHNSVSSSEICSTKSIIDSQILNLSYTLFC